MATGLPSMEQTIPCRHHTMNQYTRHHFQFVLYSTCQLVSSNGAGFWSNTAGWVEFKEATRFTVSSVPTCNMPMSQGQDAKWIMWEPRLGPARASAAGEAPVALPLATH